MPKNAKECQTNKTYKSEHMKNIHKRKQAKQVPMSLEEIFNNFYYKILYSYPFIGDYYINTML